MPLGTYATAEIPVIGRIWIAKTFKGIARLTFGGDREAFLEELSKEVRWVEAGQPQAVASEFFRYARGELRAFRTPIDLYSGTPFQRRVWGAIATIPWGETRSYADLARQIGKPKATRAVANACGANPVPIIIPCHRVIASDGSLGGFSSGIEIKQRLLDLERRLNSRP